MFSHSSRFFGLFLCFLAFNKVKCDCPSVDLLPTWYEEDSTFLCATRFTGKPTEEGGCQMCSTDDDPDPMGIFIKDDETASLDCEGCYIPMGSVVVKPGCTLTAFEGSHFTGNARTFGPGVSEDSDGPITGPDCGNGWKSYNCECIQKPTTCKPSDEWKMLQRCDNREGSSNITCKATYNEGTIYEQSIQDGFTISSEVEEALRTNLWSRYKNFLGDTGDTGFDWSDPGAEWNFKDEHEGGSVSFIVLPGCIGYISQIFGYCGESVTKVVAVSAGADCQNGTVIMEEYTLTPTGSNLKP